MDTKRLTDGLFVSAQITPADLKEIAASGFRSVICNRPDGEEPGQPPFAAIADAAQAAGVRALYLPVIPGQIGDDDARAFAKALRDLPGPALAYCRSGARSANLASLGASA